MTRKELLNRYNRNLEDPKQGVHIVLEFRRRDPKLSVGGLPVPESLILMTVPQEEHLSGLLIMENLSDPSAFRESDRKKLMRFREHAISALTKAKVFKDLLETQKELVKAAHTAGMAEIATNVLHSLGNSLNSVKISVHLIEEMVEDRKWVTVFEKVIGLLRESDLTLQENDPAAGQRIAKALEALDRIFRHLTDQGDKLQNESTRLGDHLQSMVAVLREQQRYTQLDSGSLELTDLNALIQETLKIEHYMPKETRVKIAKHLQPVPPVALEQSKFMRILFYILRNAWEAIAEQGGEGSGVIDVYTRHDETSVFVELEDNGIGIPQEHLSRVFLQGFSTKRNFRGFSLHYCANAMKEMSGSIQIFSEGEGHGTRVSLLFPIVGSGPKTDHYDTVGRFSQLPDHISSD